MTSCLSVSSAYISHLLCTLIKNACHYVNNTPLHHSARKRAQLYTRLRDAGQHALDNSEPGGVIKQHANRKTARFGADKSHAFIGEWADDFQCFSSARGKKSINNCVMGRKKIACRTRCKRWFACLVNAEVLHYSYWRVRRCNGKAVSVACDALLEC